MRNTLLCTAVLTLCLLISGCGQLLPARSTLPTFSPAPPTEETQPVTEPAAPPQPDRTPMLEAYQAVLEQLCFEHIWPDGTDAGFDSSFGSIEQNEFAVSDVDGDGADELVIAFSTTFNAGMRYSIFGYDPATRQVRPQLEAYPGITIYDNGVIQGLSSHNHSFSMEFWPYTLYRYDPATDSYGTEVYVSGWEKQYADTDYDGHPFPEDKAENGMVYRMEQNGAVVILSPGEYARWEEENLSGTPLPELPWQFLDPAVIRSLTTGTPSEDWRRGLSAPENFTWQGSTERAFLIVEDSGIAVYRDAPAKTLIARALFPKPLQNARDAEVTFTLTDLSDDNETSDIDAKFRFPDGSQAELLWLWDEQEERYVYNTEFSWYPGEPTGKG